jgi:hypothetical protein
VKTGALTRDDIDLLSPERASWILTELFGIDEDKVRIADIQQRMSEAYESQFIIPQLLTDLLAYQHILTDAKQKILAAPCVSLEPNKQLGKQLPRITPAPMISGLSNPFRSFLNDMVSKALAKVTRLIEIGEAFHEMHSQKDLPAVESDGEIPIDPDWEITSDGDTWRMMLESFPDDRMGSFGIASYGDNRWTSDQIKASVLIEDF